MSIKVNNDTVIFDDRTLKLSSGTTRPASPSVGTFWFHQSNGLEAWDGEQWRSVKEAPPPPPPSFGFARCAGRNGGGQLGSSTVINRSTPFTVSGSVNWDFVYLAGGQFHSLGIRVDGTAWAWGLGTYGVLGENSTLNRSSPVTVAGGITDWTQVAAGDRSSFALRANGTLWAWGRNSAGQLGINFTTSRRTPQVVVGDFTDWTQVAGASSHTVALRSNGTVWAWGGNSYGQLGTNDTINRSSPVSVIGGFTDWVQLSTFGLSSNHHTALRANGTLWAWGRNNLGQLGIDNVINSSSPVSVVGGITDWTQVSSGKEHTVALRANGTAWAWGSDGSRQLGDLLESGAANRSSPVSVIGGFTDWVQVSAGGNSSSGIRAQGSSWSWGDSEFGQSGDGTTLRTQSSPTTVVGTNEWIHMSRGLEHLLLINRV
jgi:alpha-tubulin suppressor-like RCC1 family protein